MINKNPKIRRQKRVRSKIHGSATTPRLSVFRSNKHLFAQLIDDAKSQTLVGLSTKGLLKHSRGSRVKRSETSDSQRVSKSTLAASLGELIAQKAQELKIKTAVFDRGYFRYHGRLRTFADAARKAGLKI